MAGSLGALLTVWATFAPCFLWIFLGAPFIESLRRNANLSAALGAITAAVVGVIAHLALWFGLHVLFGEVRAVPVGGLSLDLPVLSSVDWRAAVLASLALLATQRFKMGVLPLLAICAPLGALLKTFA